MKKNLIAFCIMLFACAFLTSCKKELGQRISVEEADEMIVSKVGNNASCKLTHLVWADYFTWDFGYNDKGLADEWRLDAGFFVWNFKMKYDKFNKLVEAPSYDEYGNLLFTYYFTYEGNRVISQKLVDSGPGFEVLFSYNSKGQIIRLDDNDNDLHQVLSYDNMGNCTRADSYIGSDLYFSDIYEFDLHVRNPLLTVSGVDFLFPYQGVGYFNKLWFSRNLSIVYFGDGNEFVINDLVAAKEDVSTTQGNLPSAINYYDKVIESVLNFNFGYSCNTNNNLTDKATLLDNRSAAIDRNTRHPILLPGTSKAVKEQLQELRRQYSK